MRRVRAKQYEADETGGGAIDRVKVESVGQPDRERKPRRSRQLLNGTSNSCTGATTRRFIARWLRTKLRGTPYARLLRFRDTSWSAETGYRRSVSHGSIAHPQLQASLGTRSRTGLQGKLRLLRLACEGKPLTTCDVRCAMCGGQLIVTRIGRWSGMGGWIISPTGSVFPLLRHDPVSDCEEKSLLQTRCEGFSQHQKDVPSILRSG